MQQYSAHGRRLQASTYHGGGDGKSSGCGWYLFQIKDPKALLAWYQTHLGMPDASPYFAKLVPASMPAGGCTAFTPFSADTDYFAPAQRDFMFNLVVDDLDGALQQVSAAGATLVGEPQSYDFG